MVLLTSVNPVMILSGYHLPIVLGRYVVLLEFVNQGIPVQFNT